MTIDELSTHDVATIAKRLAIVSDKLPPLPTLPRSVADLPFVHKSYAYQHSKCTGWERELDAELNCHNLHEHLGDAVIKLFVTDWATKQLHMESGISHVCVLAMPGQCSAGTLLRPASRESNLSCLATY